MVSEQTWKSRPKKQPVRICSGTLHPAHKREIGRVELVMQRLEKVDRTLSEYKAGVEVVKEIQETRELLTLIEGNIHGRHVAGCLRDAMESKDIEAVRGQIEEFVKVFKRYGG